MARIAVEATGCDQGFLEVLKGANEVLKESKGLEIILVAGKDEIPDSFSLGKAKLELSEYTYDSTIKETQAESSIYNAMQMHKDGEVDAVIAPGDTRGAVGASIDILGLMPKVLAPAIATHWPTTNVLIDSGGHPFATEYNLFQSAIMGHVFSKHYVGVEKPVVGVLANGHEKNKGNKFTMKSRALINRLHRDAGYDVLRGGEDRDKKGEWYFESNFYNDLDAGRVVVTDGMTGNILLKAAEGTAKLLLETLYKKVKDQNILLQGCAYVGLRKPVKDMRSEFRYEEYAVAPLLGVDGVTMIAHGRSCSETITNSIKRTCKYLGCNINDILRESIDKYSKVKK
ncbi:hypothetical protein GOV14_04995 [Candidatus Pacearchaeota archaeon]|nr:hypothetical protein [Candidatus Pacearchaeota archaeon]